jgi:hypothetical protein
MTDKELLALLAYTVETTRRVSEEEYKKAMRDLTDKMIATATEETKKRNDIIEALQAQLKTVLDREAETHRRHDAKVEAGAHLT